MHQLDTLIPEVAPAEDARATKRRKTSGRKKKAAAKKPRAKAAAESAPEVRVANPKKLPKTRLLGVRFQGDTVEMTFRDLRKLKTPLKYLDKRLPKLTAAELRKNQVDRSGKTITWPQQGLVVHVAEVLQFQH